MSVGSVCVVETKQDTRQKEKVCQKQNNESESAEKTCRGRQPESSRIHSQVNHHQMFIPREIISCLITVIYPRSDNRSLLTVSNVFLIPYLSSQPEHWAAQPPKAEPPQAPPPNRRCCTWGLPPTPQAAVAQSLGSFHWPPRWWACHLSRGSNRRLPNLAILVALVFQLWRRLKKKGLRVIFNQKKQKKTTLFIF